MKKRQKKKNLTNYTGLMQETIRVMLARRGPMNKEELKEALLETVVRFLPESPGKNIKVWADEKDPMLIHFRFPVLGVSIEGEINE